jgi:hypothetical protein
VVLPLDTAVYVRAGVRQELAGRDAARATNVKLSFDWNI